MVPAPILPFEPFIRYLGPTAALQEVIYGLVMVLAALSAFSVGFGLDEGTRWTVIFAALAVNLAWGLVDMVMWSITRNFDRMRRHYLARSIKENPGEAWTLEAIEDDLSDSIVGTLDPTDRERICLDVLESTERAPSALRRIDRDALWGGLSAFTLTILAALPVLAPVMVIDPPLLGLRVASVVNVALLFLVGYSWAPYAGLNKWKIGLVLMLVGGAITLTTVALGG